MAMLSLGNVASIIAMGNKILGRIGPDGFAKGVDFLKQKDLFTGLKYRFYSSTVLQEFCVAIARSMEKFGSLESGACAARVHGRTSNPSMDILAGLRSCLLHHGAPLETNLLPDTDRGSAKKRYAMFLRWAVRSDEIDLGLWQAIHPRDLFMPVDTHILRNCRVLGLTTRTRADEQTAWELTEVFKSFYPEDPIRFDFSISRVGIHPALKNIDLATIMNGGL